MTTLSAQAALACNDGTMTVVQMEDRLAVLDNMIFNLDKNLTRIINLDRVPNPYGTSTIEYLEELFVQMRDERSRYVYFIEQTWFAESPAKMMKRPWFSDC